ncbi:zinc-binding alcohol dehydrogenase family protein [Colwellia sp. 6_MG-2023]|uniref:zinc-binding alcohol dehydrogenase family protein n=1 Tax=Colwellia sp. 6_MG-2023 TaxID=3062676 RepID=UPI0026E1B8A3|nr:zinc-binding alcohol dehydrogenase family protein [Colwellia sp. 6_MG-2023]MDO6486304.1 zinc-binding alcohol dehydrogenase family protein [Colwellia sp. 6_MG-2023]
MKAIGYEKSLPISELASLVDIEMKQPTASGHDLLVRVKSIAVNPVDCKIRQNVAPEANEYKIIGWDAVGEVVGVGELVTHFKLGDSVFYAGDLNRQGCNAEYQLVDERIVGNKPKSLSDSEAAALPLTSITAWELLFERLAIKQQQPDNKEKSKDVLLIVGAAGGVGSILVQLASVLTGATVIATASRDSSAEWVKKLGADHVVDHSKPLVAQIEQLNIGQVTHVASLTHTDSYMDSYVEMLAPMGRIALIDDPQSVDIKKLKPKSLSLHWEFMFTRSMFQTEDINEQHNLLNSIAELIDQGYLQTTVGKHLGGINATNLRAAHAEIESGKSIGKIVLEGF